MDVEQAVAIAIPLAVAGTVLTIFVRTITTGIAHAADRQAESGNVKGVDAMNIAGLMLQGLRIAIPAALIADLTGFVAAAWAVRLLFGT